MSKTKIIFLLKVDYLYEIAKKYNSGCSVKKLENQDDEIKMFELLLRNKLVLVAYDCDLNFEPCNKNGLKAHWALLIGLALPIESKYLENFTINETENTNLVYTSKSIDENQAEILHQYSQSSNIFAICRQGKSKHCGVWNLSKLIESNRQLKFIDHLKCDDENFIKPEDGDLQKTLAYKYLVFE